MASPVEKPDSARFDRPFRQNASRKRVLSPLDRDIECAHCSYNLRGLRPNGRCPECDEDINYSLAAEVMWLASPRWLRRQALGLLTMVAANLGAAVVIAQSSFFFAIIVALGWSASLVLLWWPDRRHLQTRTRMISRWMLILTAAADTMIAAVMANSASLRPLIEWWIAAGLWSSVLAVRAHARLCDRLPEPGMAGLMRVFSVFLTAGFLPWIPWRLVSLRGDGAIWQVSGCGVVLAMVVLYVCMFVFMILAAELVYLAHSAPRDRADSHPSARGANATLAQLDEGPPGHAR